MSGPTKQDMEIIRAQVWQHQAIAKHVRCKTAQAVAEAAAIASNAQSPEIVRAVAQDVLEQVGCEARMDAGKEAEPRSR